MWQGCRLICQFIYMHVTRMPSDMPDHDEVIRTAARDLNHSIEELA
jgi:hypothetical protein